MIRNITIQPALNGFIVSVGCQTLCYTGREKLIQDLDNYLRDPAATEKRIVETEGINRVHTMETRGIGDDLPSGNMADGQIARAMQEPH